MFKNSILKNSIKTLLAGVSVGLSSFVAMAQCTDPAYVPGTAYSGGAKVSYNNIVYTANWWTQNTQPDLNSGATGTGMPWTQTGTCGTVVKPITTINSPSQGQITYLTPSAGNLTSVNIGFNVAYSLIDSVRYTVVETPCDGPGCTVVRRYSVFASPFSLNFLSGLKYNGYTEVQVVAFSKGIAADVVSRSFYVKPLPEVTIITPVNNSNAPRTLSTLDVSVSVNSANLTIDSVVYIVQDVKGLGTPYTDVYDRKFVKTAPFNFTFPVTPGQDITRVYAIAFGDGKASASKVSVVNYNNAPSVTITDPIANQRFSVGGSVTIKANVTDTDGSIAKVEIYSPHLNNGAKTTLTAAPYELTFTNMPTSGMRGATSFVVIATDNKGATNGASIDVYENKLPYVTLTSPLAVNGITPKYLVGGNMTVSANVGDYDGTITKVEISRGVNYEGVVTLTAAPYTATFTNLPAPAPDGSYSFNVKAYDNHGGITNQLVIVYKNRIPSVTITSPVMNATFQTASNITVSALANDGDWTSGKLEYFFNGSVKIGEQVISGALQGTSYSIPFNNVANGTYSLTVRATDDMGEYSYSAPVNITVAPQSTCSAATYNAATAYSGGAVVQYNGIKYSANWWVQGAQPDLNSGATGSGKPWTNLGTCNSRIEDATVLTTGIFPNPTKGEFTISVEDKSTAVISNSMGEQVSILSLESGSNRINSNLSTGIYFININNKVSQLVVE